MSAQKECEMNYPPQIAVMKSPRMRFRWNPVGLNNSAVHGGQGRLARADLSDVLDN